MQVFVSLCLFVSVCLYPSGQCMRAVQRAPSLCRDTHPLCEQWAIKCECNKNMYRMRMDCARSCGHCLGVPAVRVPLYCIRNDPTKQRLRYEAELYRRHNRTRAPVTTTAYPFGFKLSSKGGKAGPLRRQRILRDVAPQEPKLIIYNRPVRDQARLHYPHSPHAPDYDYNRDYLDDSAAAEPEPSSDVYDDEDYLDVDYDYRHYPDKSPVAADYELFQPPDLVPDLTKGVHKNVLYYDGDYDDDSRPEYPGPVPEAEPVVCADTHSARAVGLSCARLADQCLCTSGAAFMQNKCAATCGFCGHASNNHIGTYKHCDQASTGLPAACRDHSLSCGLLWLQGLCRTQHEFMHAVCPRACRRC